MVGRRLAAFLVDWGLLTLASALVSWPSGGQGGYVASYQAEVALEFALWMAYFGLGEGLLGVTPGKWLADLRTRGCPASCCAKALALACVLEVVPALVNLLEPGLGGWFWPGVLAAYATGWTAAAWLCWPRWGRVSWLDAATGVRVECTMTSCDAGTAAGTGTSTRGWRGRS